MPPQKNRKRILKGRPWIGCRLGVGVVEVEEVLNISFKVGVKDELGDVKFEVVEAGSRSVRIKYELPDRQVRAVTIKLGEKIKLKSTTADRNKETLRWLKFLRFEDGVVHFAFAETNLSDRKAKGVQRRRQRKLSEHYRRGAELPIELEQASL